MSDHITIVLLSLLCVALAGLVWLGESRRLRARRSFYSVAGKPWQAGERKMHWCARVPFCLDKWEVEALILSMQQSPRTLNKYARLHQRLQAFYKQEEERDEHGPKQNTAGTA